MSQITIYGYHAVIALLKHHPHLIKVIHLQNGRQDKRAQTVELLANQHHITLQRVEKEKLTQKAQTEHHQGILAMCSALPTYHENDLDDFASQTQTVPFFLILDGVQDPHNLGACIRTAEAAGVHALIIPKDASAPINQTVRKVACGAAEILPIITATNLSRTLKKLKELGVWLVGTAAEAETSLYKTDLTIPVGLVLGNEEKGMRRLTKENCDFLASIPLQGTVASLNVSVATGICVFEVVRQRLSKPIT